MKIFTGNINPTLAEDIAKYLQQDLGEIDVGKFPDGEISVKIKENVRGKDVFIVQPTCGSNELSSNDALMELLIIVDAMKRSSASRITAVVPFFGYARQDRKNEARVPITARLVANLLESSGIDRILFLDLHSQQIQGFFNIPVDHLYASSVLVKYIEAEGFNNSVVVAPDVGGAKMAQGYSKLLGTRLAIVNKERIDGGTVEAFSLVGQVGGKNCILVDDMTSTAGTLCAAASMLEERGAKSVIAVVSHALISGAMLENLSQSSIGELITTDSIPWPEDVEEPEGCPKITALSLASLLGEAIDCIHGNKSVSSLFANEKN